MKRTSKKTSIKKLGSFQMTSKVARVSDPCYEKDTWCSGTVSGIRKGAWNAHVFSKDKGAWGVRCAHLIAHNVDFPAPLEDHSQWERQDIDVAVDSGQAGIFDESHFKDDEVVKGAKRIGDNDPICEDKPWYSICCDRTLSKVGAGIIPYGCVSSSGYGDGCYPCFVIKQRNQVVAIKIDFGI